MNTHIICLIVFLSIESTLRAQKIIQIKTNTKISPIAKQILFLEDRSRHLTLKDILKPSLQKKFQRYGKDVFHKNVPPSAFWFKLTIQNQTSEKLWLEIGKPSSVWYADLYLVDTLGNSIKNHSLGAFRPNKNKDISASNYYVKLPASQGDTPKTYYLRVEGSYLFILSLRIGVLREVVTHIRTSDRTITVFLSLIFSLWLYNLFLLYSTRDKMYFFYLLYISCVTVNISFQGGYPLIWVKWIWENYFILSACALLTRTVFAIHYLELASVSRGLYRLLWTITLIKILVTVLFLVSWVKFFSFSIFLHYTTSLLHVSCLLLAGLYVWYRGHTKAKFYVLAWGVWAPSVFIFIFMKNGILPVNWLTQNIIYIGVGVENLLLALALGHRLKTLQQEKKDLQTKHSVLIEEQNIELEHKVKEKTKKLRHANEELVSTNEELQQIQEKIEIQRDELTEANKKLILSQTRIAQSIKVAKEIQQALHPPCQKFSDYFEEYFIMNYPKDVVSGDFYWLDQVRGKVLLIIGDCTGHGVPGAFMTMMGHNLLDKIIRQEKETDPVKIVNQLHTEIQRLLRQEITGNTNGMDTVIITLTPLPETKGKSFCLEFVGAKNDLLYWDIATQKLCELKSTRKSIGGFQNRKRQFEKKTTVVQKGSILYMGSDGLKDQHNAQRRKLGNEILREIIEKNSASSLDKQHVHFEAVLQNHMRNTDQRDDILWLGLRI